MSFLHQEDAGPANLSLGGCGVFEGRPPTLAALRRHVEARLRALPKYRQRLHDSPAGIGGPLWADDPDFHLAAHVHEHRLLAPADDTALWEAIAAIFARRMDRGRPLWELHLIPELEGGRFALLIRNHHAFADGISAATALGLFCDLAPQALAEPTGFERWRPAPPPDAGAVLRSLWSEQTDRARTGMRRSLSALRDPRRLLGDARRAWDAAEQLAQLVSRPAPPMPFNVLASDERTYLGVRLDLAEAKAIKNALGGKVNDVLLTVVARGMAGLLDELGVERRGLELRCLVPQSVRRERETHALGNRVVAMRVSVPMDVEEPVELLGAIRWQMAQAKRSAQTSAVEAITGALGSVPSPLLGPLSRMSTHPRIFNLLVTNVPGPPFPVYLNGAPCDAWYPIGFLTEGHALCVAAVSCDTALGIGILADPALVPDLDAIGDGITGTMDALARAAGVRQAVSSPRASAAEMPSRI